jgi:hypothetical protein
VAPSYDVYYLEQAGLVGRERNAGAWISRQGILWLSAKNAIR